MAEGKNGFILYRDYIHTVEKLSDERAGKLMKHLFRYVNDLNPVADDEMVDLAFEPLKAQLKRDLKHWESVRESRSESGKKGANKRWEKVANDSKSHQKIAKMAVSVTDNDNVNDNVNDNDFISTKIPPDRNKVITYTFKYQKEKKSVQLSAAAADMIADEFIDFYSSKGWLVGKSKMKDWQAALRRSMNEWQKIKDIIEADKPIERPKYEE